MSITKWIIGILTSLIIFLLLILGLLLVIWQSPVKARADKRLSQSTTPVSVGFTTMPAYELALIRARQWQPDASLIKANATWPQEASREELILGTNLWSFGFYSAGSASVANISVVEDQVTLVNQHRVIHSLNPLQTVNWSVDSNVAVLRLMDDGGETFLENNGLTTLTMVLTNNEETGRIEWLLSVFSGQTNEAFVMRLDAATGVILAKV